MTFKNALAKKKKNALAKKKKKKALALQSLNLEFLQQKGNRIKMSFYKVIKCVLYTSIYLMYNFVLRNTGDEKKKKEDQKWSLWDAWEAQRLSICLWLRA